MKKIAFLISSCIVVLFACKQYQEVEVLPNEVIQIKLDTTVSVFPANGSTVLPLKVMLPADVKEEFKVVTFSVSDAKGGTFVGNESDNANIKVGSDGIARTYFKIGTVPGSYIISAQVKSGSIVYKANQLKIDLTGFLASDLLAISAEQQQPPADGVTTFKIFIESKYPTDKKVKLNASLGSFLNSTTAKEINVDLDNQGKGFALFKMSNELASHVITGSFAQGAVATIVVNPTVSYPESIYVESTKLYVDTTGQPTVLNIFLRKGVGKVSVGRPVQLMAYQLVNGAKVNVGRFTGLANAIADGEGNVPAVSFFADTKDIDTKQSIIIEVATDKALNEKITTKILITFSRTQ